MLIRHLSCPGLVHRRYSLPAVFLTLSRSGVDGASVLVGHRRHHRRDAGRPWTFVWILDLPAVGGAFHTVWCLRHGINPLTAEPRDRYQQLRNTRRRRSTT